jgi:hypothetical protein
MRISRRLSFGKGYTGIACETLEASEFLRSEIVDEMPSLYCHSTFESDMCVYSASAIYD